MTSCCALLIFTAVIFIVDLNKDFLSFLVSDWSYQQRFVIYLPCTTADHMSQNDYGTHNSCNHYMVQGKTNSFTMSSSVPQNFMVNFCLISNIEANLLVVAELPCKNLSLTFHARQRPYKYLYLGSLFENKEGSTNEHLLTTIKEEFLNRGQCFDSLTLPNIWTMIFP